MKRRLLALTVIICLLIPNVTFASDIGYEEILASSVQLYETEVKSSADAVKESGGLPDESKAEVLLFVDPSYISNRSLKDSVSFLFVFIPDKETDDIYFADYGKKGVTAVTKNFDFGGKLTSLYSETAKDAIMKIDDAQSAVNISFGSRVGFLGYYIFGKEKNYVILYDILEENKYNAAEESELEAGFGKIYEEEEFVSLLEKEALSYKEYVKKQNEERKGNASYKDKNGDVLEAKTDKKEKKDYDKDRDDDKDEACSCKNCPDKECGKDDCDCDLAQCSSEECREEAREAAKEKEPSKKDKRKNKIKTVNGYGVFKGDENGNLNEDSYITRAEFAAVVCNMLSLEIGGKWDLEDVDFDDVSDKHWAKNYIKAARKAGIIAGRGGNIFDPDAKITFEEAMKMIVACVGYTSKAEQKGGFPYGYTEVAKELGVTADLETPKKGYALRGDVMEMVYNSLDIPFMLQKSFGENVEYEIADGKRGDKKTLRIILEVELDK